MTSTGESRETKLAEIIKTSCLNSEEPIVSGSAIGTLVKEHFPGLDFRREYQGLSSFIRTNCPNDIVKVGKRGADNLFIHKEREHEAHNVTSRNLRPWIVFSDPRLDTKLFANPESGELKVTSDDSAGEEFLEINRLNESDYREIANEFLTKEATSGEKEVIQSLKNIIIKPNFWFDFVASIQSQLGKESRDRFLQYRTKKISEIFGLRLSDIGMGKSLVEATINQVAKRPQNHYQPTVDDQKINIKAKNFSSPGFPTRTLIHEAIKLMSQDELRRINLPVGVMVDALKKLI